MDGLAEQSTYKYNAEENLLMNINDILKKLKYKDEYKSLVLNTPGEYEEAVKKIGFDMQAGADKYDFAHLFVNDNRDKGWDTVKNLGLRPVSQIAIDETWSALRFRPVERVRKK